MPIDYQQVYEKIQEIGKGLRERRRTLEERRARVWELLNIYNLELDLLNSLVDSAKQADPGAAYFWATSNSFLRSETSRCRAIWLSLKMVSSNSSRICLSLIHI